MIRSYWLRSKCPKCGAEYEVKSLEDEIVESSKVMGDVIAELVFRCGKCGELFDWKVGRMEGTE